jgi:hypothetical protein
MVGNAPFLIPGRSSHSLKMYPNFEAPEVVEEQTKADRSKAYLPLERSRWSKYGSHIETTGWMGLLWPTMKCGHIALFVGQMAASRHS